MISHSSRVDSAVQFLEVMGWIPIGVQISLFSHTDQFTLTLVNFCHQKQ